MFCMMMTLSSSQFTSQVSVGFEGVEADVRRIPDLRVGLARRW